MNANASLFNRIRKTGRNWWLRKTQQGRRFFVGTGLLVVSAVASLSIFATAPTADPEINPEKAWPVSVLKAQPADLTPLFSTYGRVESSAIAELRSVVVAPIAQVNIRAGQWVEQGDVLVELQTTELNLRVTEREADLAQQQALLASTTTEFDLLRQTTGQFKSVYDISQKKLKRHQDLFEKHMIAQSLLDEIEQQANQNAIQYQTHTRTLADFPNRIESQKAQVKRAEAQLAQARINLEKAKIAAPFSGPVLEVAAAPGNYSSMSVALVKLANVDGLEIRAPISNAYVDRFRSAVSDDREISASAELNGETYTLRFTRLANNMKQGQSGLDAYFQVLPEAHNALPEVGRVLQLTITLPAEPAVVALPVQALYDNDRIYQVVEGRLSAITIERVGDYRTAQGEYRILVRSREIETDQRIITTQLPRAISGLLVEEVNPAESESV